MKFKKILTFSAAALMLASVGAGIGNTQASASNYMGADERRATYSRRVYVRRPIKLEKMSGSVFATMRATNHKWLHKGERIGVVPFYHMGHDGYVVHIPGCSGVYYAPTNNHSWYGANYRRRIIRHHSHGIYVRHPIKLEKLKGKTFATMRVVGHLRLHKNEKLNSVVPFYHMGHDGYTVRVHGYRGTYYAATNSHSWYEK